MTIPQFKRWLEQKIDYVQAFPNEARNPDDHIQIQGFIEEAYEHAVALRLPEAAAACRKGPVTVRLLECLKAIPSARTVLTPPQIAEQLGRDEQTVRDWITSGQLKGSNLASASRSQYVVKPEDLEVFLASRQPNPPAPRPARAEQPTTYCRFSEE